MQTRIERRKEATRALIIDKALELFCLHGLERVSLEDIADASDVSRGTIYNFFENRDSLLTEALGPALISLTERADTLLASEQITLETIFSMFADTWKGHQKALALTTVLRNPIPEKLGALHGKLIVSFNALFARASDLRSTILANAESLTFLMFRISVPLLEAMRKEGVPDSLYAGAMLGLFTRT